jgi:parvulin-like peptidyl-prolyl isomerase
VSIINHRPHAALLLGAALAVLCACSGQKAAPPKQPPTPSGDNVQPAASADNGAMPVATAASGGKELFSINGEPVDARQLQIFIQELKSEDVRHGERAIPGLVDSFINNRVLAALAEKEGVDHYPDVAARIEIVTNRLWNDPLWSRVVRPSVKIDEKKLKAKAPKFEEMISVQQLVAKTREEAEQYRARLLKGEDFGKMIKEHSVGLSARNEGKSGYIDRTSTQYDPAVIKVLFALKPNEYSQVHETQIGHCVYRLVDRKTPEQLKKEWWAGNRDKLVGEVEKQAWNELKDKLVTRHKVKLNKKVISAYLDARKKNESVAKYMNQTAVTIDNTQFSIDDIANPSGMGVIHGTETLDMLANKRIEDYVIEKEVERLGLKKEFPEIALKERILREHLLARGYVDAITSKFTVTEKERADYFAKNRDKYFSPRKLDASFIETKSDARLKSIYEALAKGEAFEKVAEQWSDNSRIRSAPVPEDKINPEFAAITKLKVGEYTREPIRLKVPGSGVTLFLVARLNAVQEKRPLAYAEIEPVVLEKAVLAFKREEAVTALLTKIRKENKVVFTKGYDEFKERFKNNMSTQGGGR